MVQICQTWNVSRQQVVVESDRLELSERTKIRQLPPKLISDHAQVRDMRLARIAGDSVPTAFSSRRSEPARLVTPHIAICSVVEIQQDRALACRNGCVGNARGCRRENGTKENGGDVLDPFRPRRQIMGTAAAKYGLAWHVHGRFQIEGWPVSPAIRPLAGGH